MREKSLQCPSLALGAISVALIAICIFSFFHITTKDFTWHGKPRHFTFRGGEICVDNEPQRSVEYAASCGIVTRERQAWETKHNQLLTEMEHAPYGPQYTAARLRMDAWEAINGIRWTKWPTPTSPHVEHRVQLLWLAALLAAAWIAIQLKWSANTERAAARRRLVFRTTVVLVLIAIATVWVESYRQVLAVCIYAPRSIYTLTALRGRVAMGLPPVVDPAKYSAIEEAAWRIRNEDADFLVGPMNIAPQSQLVPMQQRIRLATQPSGYVMVTRTVSVPQAVPAQFVSGISAGIHRDSAFDRLKDFATTPEAQRALLEALCDSDRYVAAHVFMSERMPRGFVMIKGQRMTGSPFGNAHYSGSTFAGLKIALLPEQAKLTKFDRPIVPLNIVPGQMSAIEMKWHRVLDQQTRAVSLAWTTPLLLLPIYWAVSVWRRRRRRRPNHCDSCGYNLTGNTSGICPECGAVLANAGIAAINR